MAYEHGKHGVATRQCWGEVNPSTIQEFTNSEVPLENTRWAQLVHIVADDSGGTSTSGAASTSQKIVTSGDKTYICECISGQNTSESDALWRIKEIDQITSDLISIKWANGVNTFTNIATDPTTLTYNY